MEEIRQGKREERDRGRQMKPFFLTEWMPEEKVEGGEARKRKVSKLCLPTQHKKGDNFWGEKNFRGNVSKQAKRAKEEEKEQRKKEKRTLPAAKPTSP